jgi:4-amino-4-deoxy-L-arabinose transferase-like glycosyltransferase
VKSPRAKQRLLLCLLAFITFFIWFSPALKDDLGYYGGDSAQYIIVAQSVVKGEGLRAINYPATPLWTKAPLFPLMLVPIIYFFGVNLYLLHLFIILLSCLLVVLIYIYFSSFLDNKQSLLLAGIIGFNYFFFITTSRILTEIPFTILVILSFIYLERYKKRESVFNKYLILFSLSFISAYFVRYIGIVIYLSSVIYILFTSKGTLKIRLGKIAIFSLVFFVFVLGWGLRNHFLGNPAYISSYSSQFFLIDPYDPQKGNIDLYLLLKRILINISYYYPVFIGKLLFPFVKVRFILDAVAIFIFIGLLMKVKNRLSAVDIFFTIYFLFIISWPNKDFFRYLMPVYFIILYYFYFFLESILKIFCPRRVRTTCILLFLSFILINNSIFTYKKIHSKPPTSHHPFIKNFLSLHNWLNNNIKDKSAIVVSRKASITYFYTGLQSFCFPFINNPDLIWKKIKDTKARYLLVDEFSLETKRYLLPFFSKYSENLELVYRKGNSAVFRIKHHSSF